MRKLSSILPAFDRRTADDYFNQTYMESARDCQYLPPAGISRHELPSHALNLDFFTFDAFSAMCWKKSNGSAPGVSGVPDLILEFAQENLSGTLCPDGLSDRPHSAAGEG